MSEAQKTAVIIGAGPAGLTAAYELLTKTDIRPVILEEADYIGGISRTVRYNGNRMDIGGHRFFSKNDEVMDFWRNLMPIQGAPSMDDALSLIHISAGRAAASAQSTAITIRSPADRIRRAHGRLSSTRSIIRRRLR